MSQYKTHTNFLLQMQRSVKSSAVEFLNVISITLEITCACSLGGPGRNFGEHSGGNSTFGTIYPHSGVSIFGVANSWNSIVLVNYKKIKRV